MNSGNYPCYLFFIVTTTLSLPITHAQDGMGRPLQAYLQWEDHSTPSCLTRSELEAATNAMLGRNAFGQPTSDIIVKGSMVRHADNTRTATMELRTPDGESLGIRQMRSTDHGCEELRKGIPIAISLMIDTRQREVLLQLPKPEEPPEEKTIETKDEQPLEPLVVPSWAGVLEAGGSIETGLLPTTAYASRFAGVLRQESGVSFRLSLGMTLPQTARYEVGSVTVWAWQLGLGGSLSIVSADRIQLDTSWMIETGEMLSRGGGFEIEKTARSWMLEALMGPRATFPLGRSWSIGAAGWLGVPILRQRITYQEPAGIIELDRSSPVFGRGDVFFSVEGF